MIRSASFPDLNDQEFFPRLSDAKLEWLGARGLRRTVQPGEVLYEHAVRDAPLFVIERGLVELVDRKPGKDVHIAQADSRTFVGDIAAFTGEPTVSACVAVEETDVIEFDRFSLREMVARWPEFGEHIFDTLLARRAWHEASVATTLRNSVIVTGASVLLSTALACLASYAIARLPFRGRLFWRLLFVGGLIVPVQLIMIAIFIIMRWLGLLDSLKTVELMVALSEEFGVEISPAEFEREQWATPRRIVAYITSRLIA